MDAHLVLRRLRGDHANLMGLALVLESQLARLHAGESIERSLLVDIVQYVTGYLERAHEGPERQVFEALVAPMPIAGAVSPVANAYNAGANAALEALQRELARPESKTGGIVRRGFAYTRALRRRIAFEDSVVLTLASLASSDGGCAVDVGRDAADETHYRELFDAITTRVGCGCAFDEGTLTPARRGR